MKNLKNILKSLTATALLTGLAMNFNACSEQSPMSSETESVTVEQGLKILSFGNTTKSLKKTYQKSKFISKDDGGRIELLEDFDAIEL